MLTPRSIKLRTLPRRPDMKDEAKVLKKKTTDKKEKEPQKLPEVKAPTDTKRISNPKVVGSNPALFFCSQNLFESFCYGYVPF